MKPSLLDAQAINHRQMNACERRCDLCVGLTAQMHGMYCPLTDSICAGRGRPPKHLSEAKPAPPEKAPPGKAGSSSNESAESEEEDSSSDEEVPLVVEVAPPEGVLFRNKPMLDFQMLSEVQTVDQGSLLARLESVGSWDDHLSV